MKKHIRSFIGRVSPHRPRRNERGNVTVFVAISAMTIIFFAALAIDQNFLTMEQDNLQNKVEASVDSGVRILHMDSSPQYPSTLSMVQASLKANGETVSEQDLQNNYFLPGFYDYKDAYTDFATYKHFASLASGEIPSEETPNAVALLDFKKDVDTIEIKPSGQSKGRVGASAVAYGKNYTFLALDEGSEAMKWYGWESDFSKYQNCLIGSNGDIKFNGTETYDFRTRIEAVGSISSYSGTSPTTFTNVNKITVPAINWEKLRQDAEKNGKVYNPEAWSDTWQSDEYGNQFKRSASSTTITYWFIPAGKDLDGVIAMEGDHNGRTYYIDAPYPAPSGITDISLHIMNTELSPIHRRFWNATIAARCNMSTFPNPSWGPYREIQFGNYENYGNQGLVYLYSQSFYRWYTRYDLLPVALPKGVIVRCNEKFTMYSQYRYSYMGYPEEFYLKVIAGSMYLYSPTWRKNAIVFHGEFGSPDIFRQGLLN